MAAVYYDARQLGVLLLIGISPHDYLPRVTPPDGLSMYDSLNRWVEIRESERSFNLGIFDSVDVLQYM